MEPEAALLNSQLRRMRALNFKYHALFFRYINFWIAIIVGIIVAGLWPPLRAGNLLVPPLVLFAAMQGAFQFHYLIFARRFARALELKLNALTGREDLIAHELEDRYFFPLDAPRFVGFSLGHPSSFFSAITLHYGIAGTLLWLFGMWRAIDLLPILTPKFAGLVFYLPVILVWTLLNIIYLAYYFLSQRDERAVQQRLDEWLKAAPL